MAAIRFRAGSNSPRSIHTPHAKFTSQKGKFGTLKELADDELLDTSYASGNPVSQYVYTDTDVSADAYCVQATRQSNGSGDRDFNITEKGIVNYVKSATKNPVPRGEGTPISNIAGSTDKSSEAPKP